MGNCSSDISREHFISENILREIGRSGGLRISGLPWQEPDEVVAIPPRALSGKSLCGHHNGLLSSLDQLGGRFFRALRTLNEACRSGQPVSDQSQLQFDGNAVERFFLKMLMGGVASGNMRGPKGARVARNPDERVLSWLFDVRGSPPSAGLFLLGELNVPWVVEHDLRA